MALTKTTKIQIILRLFTPFHPELPKDKRGCSQKLVEMYMNDEGITIDEINDYCTKRKIALQKLEEKLRKENLICEDTK